MNQSYFDAVILGDSLAGRIAAALLARRGCRLLALRSAAPATSSTWSFSSLLLERILDQLDGRVVLTQPLRFQYLSDRARLEFHGRHPLAEELRREFPLVFEGILAAIGDLAVLGDKLAELFWECGGLPLAGIPSRWRFRVRALRRGLAPGSFDQLISGHLGKLATPTADFLGGLLPALALVDATHMTLADAALLWHGAMRPTGASLTGLAELLHRRYQQFHGEERDLAPLESITLGSRQPTRLRFKGGKVVATACLVVADAAATTVSLPAPLAAAATDPPVPIPLGGKVSPVLADQVLLSGAPPLRLSFAGPADQRRLLVESSGGVPAPEELAARLRLLFPFAQIGAVGAAGVAAPAPRPGLAAAIQRVLPEPGLFHCSPAVLPAMGNVGEVLVGLSVATSVQQRVNKGAG